MTITNITDYSIIDELHAFDSEDNKPIVKDFFGKIVTFDMSTIEEFSKRYVTAIPDVFPDFRCTDSFNQILTNEIMTRYLIFTTNGLYRCNIDNDKKFKYFSALIVSLFCSQDVISIKLLIGYPAEPCYQYMSVFESKSYDKEKTFHYEYNDLSFQNQLEYFLTLYKK